MKEPQNVYQRVTNLLAPSETIENPLTRRRKGWPTFIIS